FRQVVTEHLGFPPEQGDRHSSAPLLGRGTEQHTDMHKALYEISDSFREVHRSFVREFVLPLIGEPVVYQRIPNFRVQFPGNLGVRGMHRDREDGHDVNGLNFWLPLTPLEESNALWMEIAEGAGEHRCVPCQPGQVLVFDGANWEHGNRISTASTTRVSTDFRVVPAALFA
ncbi:hypothetical protein M5W98_30185, partial [Paenibacillus apiarius]|nr:hypothetical protein [Paenibacillus apiarius]